jgi:hypothetical protein
LLFCQALSLAVSKQLPGGIEVGTTDHENLREHDTLYGSTYEELTLVADVRRLEPKLSRFTVLNVIKALRHLGRMS